MVSGKSSPARRGPPQIDGAPRERFYRPELDGLRFLAFLGVFLSHALPHVPLNFLTVRQPEVAEWIAAVARAGARGVDLFFVLSGYLITELLVREQTLTGTVDARAFYVRRALRIWPLYYAFLAFTLLVVPYLLPDEHLSRRYAYAFGFFGANWACGLWGWPPSSIAPLWSVSVEEQFYLVWPLTVLLVPRNRLKWVAVGMILVSLLTRFALVLTHASDTAIACNTFTRLDTIAGGSLTALLLYGRVPQLTAGSRLSLGAAGAFLIVAFSRYSALQLTTWDAVLVSPFTTGGCVAVLVATLQPGSRVSPLGRQPWVYLGRISYGLYVLHLFALRVASATLAGASPRIALLSKILLGFLLTLAGGSVSFQFLEKPFLRMKERFTHVASRPGG